MRNCERVFTGHLHKLVWKALEFTGMLLSVVVKVNQVISWELAYDHDVTVSASVWQNLRA
jgi:hypothetical protein